VLANGRWTDESCIESQPVKQPVAEPLMVFDYGPQADGSGHPVFFDGHWHAAPKGTAFYASNVDIKAPWSKG
jgi:hypothetical protein